MTQEELATLSFAELRDRLKAREGQPHSSANIDVEDALRFLSLLPDSSHTSESVEALVHVARIYHYDAQPLKVLQPASRAARLALALNQKSSLYGARNLEAGALGDLGRFTEAAVLQAEAWAVAREIGDREKELFAIGNFGILCVGMGQLEVAIRYFERQRALAEEYGFVDIEFRARNSFSDCAIQLRDPAAGFRALAKFWTSAPRNRFDTDMTAVGHIHLARLYLLIDDVNRANVHAQEAARLAGNSPLEVTKRGAEAVLGFIDVKSGVVDRGLSTLDRLLAFFRHADHIDVPDHLDMCIEAHEAAGYLDKALDYLQELVAWKKKLIDAEIAPLQCAGDEELIWFQTDALLLDDVLLGKAQSLQAKLHDGIQRLVETAINAEMASGHDLYRTFRVARLAKCLATTMDWDENRIAPLTLGAQLCNIGMIAVPARVLLKRSGLSHDEKNVLRDHSIYGGQLLRRAKLRILDVPTIVAEQHHERYDGSGYPRGLTRDVIVEEARIIAICDSFDAMTHRRPWRTKPLSIQAALGELEQGAGSLFDPLLVRTFVDLIKREFWQPEDFDAFLADGADELGYVRARARMEAFIAEEG